VCKNECRLCAEPVAQLFYSDKNRDYLHCNNCQLVFADPASYLSPAEEKAQYDLHQNLPDDKRYRQFLSQLFEPLHAQLKPSSSGLDFGCGPGPTLSVMFAQAGHEVALYDHFYAPDKSVLQTCYDFITVSEVIEHLQQPLQVMDQLWAQLNPGGYLGVMTQLWDEQPDFSHWAYKQDPTHICFFSTASFTWLARRWSAKLQKVSRNVSLFHKVMQ